MKEVIFSNGAQNPGEMPYSQAIKVGNTIYVAGQGPFDPETGNLVGDTLKEQARRTMDNLKAILEEADTDLNEVVKVTVIHSEAFSFDEFNEIYKEYFKELYPARTIIPANLEFMVQIDAIAVKEN